MIQIYSIRHLYPERAPFKINRKNGHANYTFLHFLNPMDIFVDGKIVRTQPHACILFSPNVPQLFFWHQNVVHDWMHFDNVEDGFFEKLGIRTETIYYPQHPDFISRITREMENEFYQWSNHKETLLDLKFQELFIKFSRATQGEFSLPVTRNLTDSFRRLRGEMLLRLNEPWSVAKMAKAVGTSESRFHYIYKTLFGISPINDLINAKINAAKNALLSQNIPVSEISEALGYNNLTHFIRQFKQITGVSPNEYRKQG